MKINVIKRAKEVLEIEAQAIKLLKERLGRSFLKAIELILKCKGRVVVSGMGKTGIIAQKFSATLASTGTPSLFLHTAEAIHGDLGKVTHDDIVIILSNSGATEEMKQLDMLWLGSTRVTDAGLEHLKGLTQLDVLHLDGTQVTDAGLEHLKGLNQLHRLDLDCAQVTDAGLEHLKGLNLLLVLSLNGTRVTDAGLGHLKWLNQLNILWLKGTKVTDEGVKKFQQALPNCKIER